MDFAWQLISKTEEVQASGENLVHCRFFRTIWYRESATEEVDEVPVPFGDNKPQDAEELIWIAQGAYGQMALTLEPEEAAKFETGKVYVSLFSPDPINVGKDLGATKE